MNYVTNEDLRQNRLSPDDYLCYFERAERRGKTVRDTLEKSDESPPLYRNCVHGRGYRFIAHLRFLPHRSD